MKDPSYIAVRDFGTYCDPLSADRRFRECTWSKVIQCSICKYSFIVLNPV